jgi:hypothetical protein
MPMVLMLVVLVCGCQKTSRQDQVESYIHFAVSEGRSAEEIEGVLRQAEDSSQAADWGIRWVMHLGHLPQDIQENWHYYHAKEMRETPSIEIFEVINRYKITVLDVLVRYGGDLNRKDESGQPVILFSNFAPMTPELLSWLLKNGYDANSGDGSDSGRTALSYCARPAQGMLRYDQKYEMIKMLLAHGANPDVQSLGAPILETLVTYHKDDPYLVDIIAMLLEAGDERGIEGFGDAALVKALGCRREEAAMVLLGHTEAIEATNEFGVPIMNVAAGYDNEKCVEMLIARGADVNVASSRGSTPLHAAAAARNEEIIAMLLEGGANVNPVNDKRQTPLDVAMVEGNCPRDEDETAKVISLLSRRGAKRAAELK